MPLHNRALREAGTRWDDGSSVAESWFHGPRARDFIDEVAAFLQREFAKESRFVIKDPRICRLMPLWLQALARFGAEVSVILPLRHPDAVATSLWQRDGMPRSTAHLLWLRYVLDAESWTRGLNRAFVAYDRLILDWRAEQARMSGRLGIAWPRDVASAAEDIDRFVNPGLRHHVGGEAASSPSAMSAYLCEAWPLFAAMAADGAPPDVEMFLDALRERLDGLSESHPSLHWRQAAFSQVGRLWSRMRQWRLHTTVLRSEGSQLSGAGVRAPRDPAEAKADCRQTREFIGKLR